MPQSKPNQAARVFAVAALIVGFLLFVVTVATSGGGDSDDDGSEATQADSSEPTKRGERAIADGVWVVREGDTLVSIADETGLEVDELLELNPDIDAQVLATGQRISLRAGGADEEPTDSADTTVDAGDTPAPDGSGVGDEGPTGAPDETTTDGLD